MNTDMDELFFAARAFVEAIRPTIGDRLFSTRRAFYRLEKCVYGESSEPRCAWDPSEQRYIITDKGREMVKEGK